MRCPQKSSTSAGRSASRWTPPPPPTAPTIRRDVDPTPRRGRHSAGSRRGSRRAAAQPSLRHRRDALGSARGDGRTGRAAANVRANANCAEETGYIAAKWRSLGYLYASPGVLDEKLHLFVAEELTPGPARPEPDEQLHPVTVRFDEAIRMCLAGEIKDAKTVTRCCCGSGRNRNADDADFDADSRRIEDEVWFDPFHPRGFIPRHPRSDCPSVSSATRSAPGTSRAARPWHDHDAAVGDREAAAAVELRS